MKKNGIPREEIEWYPMIDKSKCTECKVCVSFCHNNCFGIQDNKVSVINPKNCVVGCTGCQSKCPKDAIRHPPKNYLDGLLMSKGKISLV